MCPILEGLSSQATDEPDAKTAASLPKVFLPPGGSLKGGPALEDGWTRGYGRAGICLGRRWGLLASSLPGNQSVPGFGDGI